MKIKNRLLLIYKKSVYQHYFIEKKEIAKKLKIQPALIKRFLRTHDHHYQTLRKVEDVLKNEGFQYYKTGRGKEIKYEEFDVVITVGGDGTFLEAARSIKDQIILGVNSDPVWSVGRFCSANNDNIEELVLRLKENKIKIKKINRLNLKLKEQNYKINILNDVLICHKNPAAMSRYYISLRKKTEEHRSSGVWVATAAGSTGAILSAGSPTLSWRSQKYQYRVRELYYGCGGPFSLKSGIVHANETLKLTSLMKDGVIFMDGSHKKFYFPFGETAIISKSPNLLKMATT